MKLLKVDKDTTEFYIQGTEDKRRILARRVVRVAWTEDVSAECTHIDALRKRRLIASEVNTKRDNTVWS
jgi:translation elongation factor EF-4